MSYMRRLGYQNDSFTVLLPSEDAVCAQLLSLCTTMCLLHRNKTIQLWWGLSLLAALAADSAAGDGL